MNDSDPRPALAPSKSVGSDDPAPRLWRLWRQGQRPDVHEFLAEAGIPFVFDGTTSEAPSLARDAYQPSRYGDVWAPVLVAWMPNGSFTSLRLPKIGLGLPIPALAMALERMARQARFFSSGAYFAGSVASNICRHVLFKYSEDSAPHRKVLAMNIMEQYVLAASDLIGLYEAVKQRGIASLQQAWSGIAPQFAKLFRNLTDWGQTAYMPTGRVRTPSWVADGAVLIGDAAHAMNPHASQGRMQAMVDAMALADLLPACLADNDCSAARLKPYEAARRPHVTMLQRLADQQVFYWNTGNPVVVSMASVTAARCPAASGISRRSSGGARATPRCSSPRGSEFC